MDQQHEAEQVRPMTIEDVWVNRLAQCIGVLTAEKERLVVQNESLTAQLEQLQQQVAFQADLAAHINGDTIIPAVESPSRAQPKE